MKNKIFDDIRIENLFTDTPNPMFLAVLFFSLGLQSRTTDLSYYEYIENQTGYTLEDYYNGDIKGGVYIDNSSKRLLEKLTKNSQDSHTGKLTVN
jgi:hypothetical protein